MSTNLSFLVCCLANFVIIDYTKASALSEKDTQINEINRARRFGNPEERGSYFEGDLVIPSSEKNGINLDVARWKNREIPYEIHQSFSQNNAERIQNAINEYHKHTCLKFIRRRSFDQDFISIENNSNGCWSRIGRIGGKQTVNLQSSICLETVGTPIHELLHAVGFFHEQNREDRDSFVKINSKNIENGREKNFEMSQIGETTGFNVAYDYGSVMHYSTVAFSKNGQPTIEAKQKTNEKIGQRDGFSKSDIEKIKRMYKC